MRTRQLVPLLTSMALLAMSASASAITMRIVGPGSNLSSIAVSPLKDLGGDDDHSISAQFISTLDRNLQLSGFFRLIDSKAYVEDPQSSGYELGQFNFADWSSINAEFLTKGAVTVKGSDVSVEVFLFDVSNQKQLTGKRFNGDRSEVPRMARRFADGILQVTTGQRGPFDTRLAFVSTRGGRFKEIYMMSPDGQNLFRITNNPTINLFPNFDHTVHQLLYTSYKSGAPALYVVNLATQRETRISSGLGELIGGALMPDGESMVAAVERGGATNLYLLDRAGGVIRPITSGGSINVNPSISPDGDHLAFTSDRSGAPQLYLVNLAGGDLKRITYKGNYNTNPAISPKGDKIAYQGRQGGIFDIYVIDLNGGEPTRLTNGEGSSQEPAWSPDGRYIVFHNSRSGSSRLYLMMADNGKIIGPLTEDNGNDSNPVWSWWLGE